MCENYFHSIFRHDIPCALILTEWICQTIIGSKLYRSSPLFIFFNLCFHFLFLFFRKIFQIQLIAEIPCCRNRKSCSKRCCPSHLMIWTRRYMSPHCNRRKQETCSMLDLQSADCIGIVTRPGLRHVIKHSCIKSAAATGTAFKQNLWKSFRQCFHHMIKSKYITMR